MPHMMMKGQEFQLYHFPCEADDSEGSGCASLAETLAKMENWGWPRHDRMFLKAPKATLASVLYRTGLLGIGGVGVHGRLIVFNYHRISPGSPDFQTPFDDGVYGPSPHVFEQQVKWL